MDLLGPTIIDTATIVIAPRQPFFVIFFWQTHQAFMIFMV